MAYIVLARKWRPQTFSEVVGQDHITTTLANAIRQNRIAHAYLFAGPRGIGKTTTARILAKALNCKDGPAPVPCNSCTNCKEITDGNSLDVLEIDGASNRGIDEIRNLRERVKFAPANSRYKVYIIDESHMLTIHAFNALLKTLEEPPSHVVFVLATTAPNKLPITILSRCQRFDFKRIKVYDIIQKLKDIAGDEDLKIDDEALSLISRSAQGSMRDAMSVLDQLISFRGKEIKLADVRAILGLAPQEAFLKLTKVIIDRDTREGLALVEGLIEQGYDIPQFVQDLMEHFRNLVMVKMAEDLVDLPEDTVEQFRLLSENFSLEDILRILDILSEVQTEMRGSDQTRLILEMLVARLTRLEPLVRADEILERLEALESRLAIRYGFPRRSLSRAEPRGSGQAGQDSTSKSRAPEKGDEPRIIPKGFQRGEQVGLNEEITLEGVKRAWPAIVKEVKRMKASVGAFLDEGEPIKAGRNNIVIGFGKDFFKESIEDPVNRKIVEAGIKKVLSREIRANCTRSTIAGRTVKKDPLTQQREEALKEPMVKAALEVFNGEVVEIIPGD